MIMKATNVMLKNTFVLYSKNRVERPKKKESCEARSPHEGGEKQD